MTKTVNALKALYIALGGNSADVANLTLTADVIAAIATFVSGGGIKELPTVSSTNNGQILTVVSGKWAAANAPKELPTVSATNNGSVLKVVDGAWAVGTDETSST